MQGEGRHNPRDDDARNSGWWRLATLLLVSATLLVLTESWVLESRAPLESGDSLELLEVRYRGREIFGWSSRERFYILARRSAESLISLDAEVLQSSESITRTRRGRLQSVGRLELAIEPLRIVDESGQSWSLQIQNRSIVLEPQAKSPGAEKR